AADQNLTSAKYNYAILLINGIGVQWDPFNAFILFQSAAIDGMIQSQYVVGILYTDNLTVKRDYNLAYYWIKKAADNDYDPAKDIVAKLEPRVSQNVVDSLLNYSGKPEDKNPIPDASENLTSSLGLVFIDFETITDSAITITDSMLIDNIDVIGTDSLTKILLADKPKNLNELANPRNIEMLNSLADNGSPEAQAILGKMYEQGIYYNRNLVDAGVYYYRALRNDSPSGTYLLWQLSQQTDFQEIVRSESENGNIVAQYLWYGLTAIGFDRRIAISDALNLLDQSADAFYLPAMVESGLNYYSNRLGRYNAETGLGIWNTASQLGSKEAEIRLTASRLLDEFGGYKKSEDFKKLKKAADQGSLFAMVTVGICNEQGIGTSQSKSEAVNYFKMAAQRGNRFAYEELKRIYDEMRPANAMFILSN
ncbi:MAG: sel1 repeat family protein, partial [Ignavibacteriaceae bacterium]|nr:sel1 repeat family protein [Ignavibacteriaceae bacterium]